MKVNHWKIRHFFLKIKQFVMPTPKEELINFIVNEAVKNPVIADSREYRNLIDRIHVELEKNKKVITVINSELVEISKINNNITIEKIRPNALRNPRFN
jgi:hypothetical protein